MKNLEILYWTRWWWRWKSHSTEKNTIKYTELLVVKGMIGERTSNLPLIIKGGSILTLVLSYIAINVVFYLGKCKDITQRYSYALYILN